MKAREMQAVSQSNWVKNVKIQTALTYAIDEWQNLRAVEKALGIVINRTLNITLLPVVTLMFWINAFLNVTDLTRLASYGPGLLLECFGWSILLSAFAMIFTIPIGLGHALKSTRNELAPLTHDDIVSEKMMRFLLAQGKLPQELKQVLRGIQIKKLEPLQIRHLYAACDDMSNN